MTDGSFDRFTERARKVFTLAQEEAQRFNHNYIGTEHLLLALVREGDGVAARVLVNLGVEVAKVRNAVEFIIGRGERQFSGEIGLTPRGKKVIELAVVESRRLGHHYIGTEHLLLGLIREGEGIAVGILESLGVNVEKVRTEVIKVLTEMGSTHRYKVRSTDREETRAPVIGWMATQSAVRRIVSRDPAVQDGAPVFTGTAVPVQTLVTSFEAGDSLDTFLEHYPSVTREVAVAALEVLREVLLSDVD